MSDGGNDGCQSKRPWCPRIATDDRVAVCKTQQLAAADCRYAHIGMQTPVREKVGFRRNRSVDVLLGQTRKCPRLACGLGKVPSLRSSGAVVVDVQAVSNHDCGKNPVRAKAPLRRSGRNFRRFCSAWGPWSGPDAALECRFVDKRGVCYRRRSSTLRTAKVQLGRKVSQTGLLGPEPTREATPSQELPTVQLFPRGCVSIVISKFLIRPICRGCRSFERFL